jgi:hypothetical protein
MRHARNQPHPRHVSTPPLPKESAMSHARTAAAALLGAALLAAPLVPALAQADTKMAEHASKATSRAESIDDRIATLHSELKITPAEESDWQAVATTMRDNATAMQKLATEKSAQSGSMTAVQDLQTYSEFAQAHVDHLKQLTAAFETLYNAMPAAQKKIADSVFSRAHQQESGNQG